MASIFEKLWRLGPAAFVFKAIIVAILADGLLLAFILLISDEEKGLLQKVLQTGALPVQERATTAQTADRVASLP